MTQRKTKAKKTAKTGKKYHPMQIANENNNNESNLQIYYKHCFSLVRVRVCKPGEIRNLP